MLRRIAIVLTCFCAGFGARLLGAASPELLQDAVQNWLGERDRWAFTQRAVEFEGDVRHERVERFDPSRAGNARWQLLTVDGHKPTAEERDKWAAKKFKKQHRKIDTPISDFFDFDAAKVVAETPRQVRFEVPLRKDKSWLFPVDKVGVRVTVNKETRALEHLSAHVREPFKVLLGVARVTGGDADLTFLQLDSSAPAPASAQPAGEARISVFKFGERVDFTWSNFQRVTPYRGTAELGHNAAAEVLTGDVLAEIP